MNVQVTIDWTRDELRELWESCMFGMACGYWADVEYGESRWVEVRERHEQGTWDHGEGATINAGDVLRGLAKMLDPDFKVSDTLRRYASSVLLSKEVGDMDPDLLDVAVQAAMFGEIRYG